MLLVLWYPVLYVDHLNFNQQFSVVEQEPHLAQIWFSQVKYPQMHFPNQKTFKVSRISHCPTRPRLSLRKLEVSARK